jgi:hypothetical protein
MIAVMKPAMLIGVVLALAATGSVPVRADSWCVHDAAGVTSPICAFSSAQDCIQAAIVGPSGTVCTREEALSRASPPKDQARRSHARRSRRQASR